MKRLFLSALVAVAATMTSHAETFVNLTPVPKQMTVGVGQLALPQSITISGHDTPEADKFATSFAAATGTSVAKGSDGLINLTQDSSIAAEGYNLDITADGIAIAASTDAGFYYAFQTLKKLTGANVAIGVYTPGEYSLPQISIKDEPRYQWRGMEIDVARHFFDVAQMKKMIDIMAVYKMNRLHWHLTDDQGWRFEMPKYPKLTQDVAAPKNQYWWDFDNHMSFLTNQQYGPYFYTVDEMKEVVAYAKERHIEVCPEVDMPGHMQCAIAAYPEFSTVPDSDHPVRYWPGVSSDILDISNPAVMQFLRDVIDQLVEIFPYEYIHIGGDECPTGNWANSQSCQDFKKEHGLTSDRAIQNWMTTELANHAKKYDRRLICWNEVLTSAGADQKAVQDADILIYAWLNADNTVKTAANLGLRSVWCSTNHYYIDYPQWNGPDEPKSMGYALTLETVYNTKPYSDPTKPDLYYGVNCNLWTEFVCENKHLEYNALPRMIAVAETGWSPEAKKDFNDFKKRFNADTELLDLGNYTYGKHYVDNADGRFKPEEGKFYRLITHASQDANRKDRCIELVHDGCDLISTKSATVGKLWTNTQADKGSDHYDWQYWTFELDPSGSGKYAMINRKAPNGSVNPAMTGSSVNARWDYDNTTKHYNFLLGEQYSSAELGGILTIRSDKGSDWYLNCAQAAQNQTVNNWNNPVDGNGGMWLFHLEDYVPQTQTSGIPFDAITSGVYGFVNSLGYGPLSVTDGALTTEADPRFGAFGWNVTAGAYDPQTNTQTLTLQNAATGLYIGVLSAEAISTIEFNDSWGVFAGNAGHTVTMTADRNSAATVTISKLASGNFSLSIDGKQLFAFGHESSQFSGAVNARTNAPEMQGSGWEIKPVTKAIRATAKDGDATVGTFYYYDFTNAAAQPTLACPYPLYEITNQTYGDTTDDHINVAVSLRKIKREVFYKLTDTEGRLWETAVDTIAAGGDFSPVAPERRYLTFKEMGAVVADTATVIYTTEATPGIGKLGEPVSKVEAGVVYAIEDTHVNRHAFRGEVNGKVMGARTAEGRSPAYLWTLEANGANFNVKNVATGNYVQELTLSKATPTGTQPHAFTFSYGDGVWKIKSTGNGQCWDGDDNLASVGWYDPGHQHKIYTLLEPEPYYVLTITEKTSTDSIMSEKTIWVKAGASYMFAAKTRPGMELVNITGHDGLDEIYANKQIVVTYSVPNSGDDNPGGDNPGGGDDNPGGDQDFIESLTPNAQNLKPEIYNLQGLRLPSITAPGLYIINGIKTLVK